jgi:hypothetical protein
MLDRSEPWRQMLWPRARVKLTRAIVVYKSQVFPVFALEEINACPAIVTSHHIP